MMNKPLNRVVHFEIHAGDPERAVKFYKDVFGWDIKKWEGGAMEYWIVMTCPENTPGGINGGIVRRKGDAPEPMGAVSGYVCSMNVADVDETVKKVMASGGTIALPKFELAGVGFMAYFKDTEGNIFGIWKKKKKSA